MQKYEYEDLNMKIDGRRFVCARKVETVIKKK